MERYRPKH